jgi:hypothetical protein
MRNKTKHAWQCPSHRERGLIFFSEADRSRVLAVLESANLAFLPIPEAIRRDLEFRWKIPDWGEPPAHLTLDAETQTNIWRWAFRSIVRAVPHGIADRPVETEGRMPSIVYMRSIGYTERVYIFRG